jgi:hypothetical protein
VKEDDRKALDHLRAIMEHVNKLEWWTPEFAKAYKAAEDFLKAAK